MKGGEIKGICVVIWDIGSTRLLLLLYIVLKSEVVGNKKIKSRKTLGGKEIVGGFLKGKEVVKIWGAWMIKKQPARINIPLYLPWWIPLLPRVTEERHEI